MLHPNTLYATENAPSIDAHSCRTISQRGSCRRAFMNLRRRSAFGPLLPVAVVAVASAVLVL